MEVRSSLLILDLKDGQLQDSEKKGKGNSLNNLHVLGMLNYPIIRLVPCLRKTIDLI